MIRSVFFATVVASLSVCSAAAAAVVAVDEGDFNASAGEITFSEFGLGTLNPVYDPSDYGGGPGSPTVTTGGFFTGQSLSLTPAVDCPAAAASACVVGSPLGGLSIDGSAPGVSIVSDGSNPTSPVLSGSPLFNGPIALLFSEDQFVVGFDGGFFDGVGSTGITAFARDGSLLGTVVNTITGIEFLGLASQDADIAGVFLDLVGSEPAGFAVDNIRFGSIGDVSDDVIDDFDDFVPPSEVPLPAGLPLLLSGLGLFGIVSLRKKRS